MSPASREDARTARARSVLIQPSWRHVFIGWSCAAISVALIWFIVYSVYRTLPAPLSASQAGPHQFSEERARVYLDHLVNGIGTRHYGSDINHHTTKSYLLGELEKMKAKANANLKIDILVDDRPGYTRFRNVTHLWESMDNVIVVIHGEKEESMLVSAHYDTVSLSAGATDNTAAVSALMEMMSILISPTASKPVYTLVVAFVQGEEIGLLGAAALAEFWPDFDKVVHFLNLDGTPGDKSMNFRSSGGYLDGLYASVKWPLGFVTAMDIFNLGLIGSDTDWSVYTRYRSGLDFATFSKRQTYHTLKDRHITEGSLQFLGDNLLGLVSTAIFDKSPWAARDRTPHVFFSVLNIVHIVYTKETAHLIHIGSLSTLIGAFFIVLQARYSIFRSVLRSGRQMPKDPRSTYESPIVSLMAGLVSVVLTVCFTVAVATIFALASSYYAQMYAYARASLAVGAIVFPSLVGLCLAQSFSVRWERASISLELSRLRVFYGVAGFWLICASAGLLISRSVGSTYFISFFTFAAAASLLLHHYYCSAGFLHPGVPVARRRPRVTPEGVHMNVSPESDDIDEGKPELATNSRIELELPGSSPWATDLLWLSLFVVQLLPVAFVFEILAPLMELAIGALGAVVFGPLLSFSVLLCLLGFIPLSRRGGHYGKLCIIFLVLAFVTFVPITLYGRSTFNADYPYVLEPRQVNDRIELRSYLPYSVDIKSMAQVLDNSFDWTCEKDNRQCFSKNPVFVTSEVVPTCSGDTGSVTLDMSTPGAWMHVISFGEEANVKDIRLNGIKFVVDAPRNFLSSKISDAADHNLRAQAFRFYLDSTEHTQQWTISFTVEPTATANWQNVFNVSVESLWAEAASAPLVNHWITDNKMPEWMSLVGLGMKGLVSLTKTVWPCKK